MRRLIILGITGSIGDATIKAVKNSSQIQIVAGSYHVQIDKAIQLAQALGIKYLIGPKSRKEIKSICFFDDYKHALEIIKPDIVVNGIKGFAGLRYTLQTLKSGVDLVIANKESIITGFPLIQAALAKFTCSQKPRLIPIDSEHFSIYTACNGDAKAIRKI